MNLYLLPLSEITTTPSDIDDITASKRLCDYGKNQIQDKKKKTILQNGAFSVI